MTKFAFTAALLLGVATGTAQDAPAMPKPQKEHEWLQQLVGEWETESEAVTEPGKPPIKSKGKESSRLIGGFWILSEHKGEFLGTPYTGILTLGYSPEKRRYTGTWIASMSSLLWTYQGSVDAAGRILTLESEGPGMEPGKLARYKDAIEVKGPDQKVLTSSMEVDGKWTTYLTVQYQRKK